MKKRSLLLAIVVSFTVLALGVGSAIAATMGPPYSSWCTAETNSEYDDGDTYAYAGGGWGMPGEAESWATEADNGIKKVGAKASVIVGPMTEFSGNVTAHAEFSQQFKVTEAGSAYIHFYYDGDLSVQNEGSGSINGMYDVGFSVSASDSYGNSDGGSDFLSLENSKSCSDSFNFYYNFTDEEVGNIFTVTLALDAYITAEYINYLVDEGQGGQADFLSDFYDTAKISYFDGGIAFNTVPIPGTVWLFGSGIMGMMAIRRRKESV